MKKLLQISGGFSLVETIVAIGILLMALSGPLSIAARGVFAAGVARDQITAYYLGQEAMEFVRAVRDGNGLSALGTNPPSPDWLNGLQGVCTGGNYCRVDVKENGEITSCGSSHGSCPPLKLQTTPADNPFYQYGGSGNLSTFVRSFTLEDVAADEKRVKVTVSWSSGIISRSLTLEENIRNWQSF